MELNFDAGTKFTAKAKREAKEFLEFLTQQGIKFTHPIAAAADDIKNGFIVYDVTKNIKRSVFYHYHKFKHLNTTLAIPVDLAVAHPALMDRIIRIFNFILTDTNLYKLCMDEEMAEVSVTFPNVTFPKDKDQVLGELLDECCLIAIKIESAPYTDPVCHLFAISREDEQYINKLDIPRKEFVMNHLHEWYPYRKQIIAPRVRIEPVITKTVLTSLIDVKAPSEH